MKTIFNATTLSATVAVAGMLTTAASLAGPGPQAITTDDGNLFTQRQVAGEVGVSAKETIYPAFEGAERITIKALAREGVTDAGTRFSPAEVEAIAALPDGGPEREALPEVIIGADRRERVYTTIYPSRARVLITFSGGRCSGTLIGANTVITAGHCLHSGGSGGSWYPRNSYLVYAGADGNSKPYGQCTAKGLYSVTGWTSSKNEAYDYGAIKLNCTVGNQVGWYGWTSSVNLNDPAIIGGYPGDKPLTHWIHADKVRAITTEQIFYANDTQPGSSGSGIWWDKNGAILIGVHAYGTHGSSPHSIYNHGKRITAAVSANFNTWKNLP